jgi:hypothetical protein
LQSSLEFFRFQESCHQIAEQQHADDNENNVFKHRLSSGSFQAFTPADVADRQRKEEHGYGNENHVKHGGDLS